MKVLVIGSGGREDALAWRVRQEEPGAELYSAPGNAGTRRHGVNVALGVDDAPGLAEFAESNAIDLTVVGPEAPLADGIADLFARKDLPVFGPGRQAAEIESSKAYAKSLMARAGIPTADYRAFEVITDAERYIRDRGAPIVVKASGLAAGKGSIVCRTTEDALDAARRMLVGSEFGAAGRTVVVEDCLEGEELSVLVLTDGRAAVPLLPAQDHKPIGEGDTGPNTGGMGAYAPVSIADPDLVGRVMDRIVMPALAALRADGRPYRGVLYCGLMIVDGDPFVIEFNCRFGDPEAQAILPLLDDSLVEPMTRVARGEPLADQDLGWRAGAAVCTVLASGGYPADYRKWEPIHVPVELREDRRVLLFHAGTRLDPEDESTVLTDGGRVMGVVGLGDDARSAAEISRAGAELVEFDGKYFRRDIGYREIERLAR